jgi:hypothetical protein
LALDLFQRAALGFGKFPPDEYEAQGADGGVKPEGVAGADGAFEPGKCVSQDETRDPEGGDGRGNRRAPDAVGESFRDHPPPTPPGGAVYFIDTSAPGCGRRFSAGAAEGCSVMVWIILV